MSSSNTYAPLPFSYLTGGGATDRRPTGMVKAKSQDGLERVGQDRDPYSVFSGAQSPNEHMNTKRKQSMDVTDPALDITDPYLLSTGALHRHGGSQQDVRNSYSEDPRYRDSVPSDTDGGNVFFRPSDDSESSGKSPRPGDHLVRQPEQHPVTSLQRPGYTNPGLDTMTRDEDATGKKLPRFKVADDGGYQYYTGSNGNGNAKPVPLPQDNNKQQKGMDNASNPIWDKYYATGGLAPGYEGYSATLPNSPKSPVSPGVRPTTKTDDFNTLLRSSTTESLGNKTCCASTKGAVLCAVLITAIICLGIGFVCGWFVYPVVNPVPTNETASTTVPALTMTVGNTITTSTTTVSAMTSIPASAVSEAANTTTPQPATTT